jgi:hypothetical protein
MSNLPTSITLADFEAVDAAYGSLLRAAPEQEARMESRLFSALVGALGFMAAIDIDDVRAYAADLLTACLTGRVETLDVEAA